MTMPVSGLRFEPLVDVQARNLAEGQADVAIRGGVFENTGFVLGTVSLYDPQTGHYFAEIPVPPAMLRQPDVLTGINHAYSGFNATAGSVRYEWGMIEPRGQADLAMGEYGMFRQSLYQGFRLWERPEGATVAMDLEAAKSSSDGTVPSGDHDFARLAGRLQLRSTGGETNLFAGYQSKFFGWPNLYTPFGFNETENLQTTLFVADHRQRLASGEWRLGAYWRRNKDDYEFNRAVPGASNPFQHTTRTQGAALEARQAVGFGDINVRAQFMRESIVSTALTFGRYSKRDHLSSPRRCRTRMRLRTPSAGSGRRPRAWPLMTPIATARRSRRCWKSLWRRGHRLRVSGGGPTSSIPGPRRCRPTPR